MADTTVTCTEKRESGGNPNQPVSVYVRSFSFPVLATTGYEASDVIHTITLPAGTLILGAWAKTTVTQGSSTLAWSIEGQDPFVAAVAITSLTGQKLTIDPDHNQVTSTDTIVTATVGSATCAAATITVSFLCAAMQNATAPYTTYSV